MEFALIKNKQDKYLCKDFYVGRTSYTFSGDGLLSDTEWHRISDTYGESNNISLVIFESVQRAHNYIKAMHMTDCMAIRVVDIEEYAESVLLGDNKH